MDCSQFPMFPWDCRDRRLCVPGGHLGWMSNLPRWPPVPVSARSRQSYEKIGDCEQSSLLSCNRTWESLSEWLIVKWFSIPFVACDFRIWGRTLYVWIWLASLYSIKRRILQADIWSLFAVRFTSDWQREGGSFLR